MYSITNSIEFEIEYYYDGIQVLIYLYDSAMKLSLHAVDKVNTRFSLVYKLFPQIKGNYCYVSYV